MFIIPRTLTLGVLALVVVSPAQPVIQFGPADQVIAPGQALVFQLDGPAGAPVAIFTDVAPAMTPTVYGLFGLAATPSMELVVDGIGIAAAVGLAPPGLGLQLPATGSLSIATGPFTASSVGLQRWVQAVVPDPTSAAGYALSVNGATSGNTSSCRALVAPAHGISLGAFHAVDVNYVEPLFTSYFGVVEDIHESITFNDAETPAGLTTLQNAGPTAHTCRLRYRLRAGAVAGPVVDEVSGAVFVVGPGATESRLDKAPDFPDLAPQPPGLYTMTAELLLEHPAGSGVFVSAGPSRSAALTVTTRRPLILVHGIIEDGTRFQDLPDMLESLSPDPVPVRRFNFASDDGAVPGLAGKVAELANFIAACGVTEYDLAAHSLGGLIVRQHLVDNPPVGWTPRLVLFGSANMGVSLAFNSVGVGILSAATPGSLSSSQFLDDIKPASSFVMSLTDSWETVASSVRVLNLIGTNCGGDSDGIVSVSEAYLAEPLNSPGTVLNRYVDEIHGTIPAFLSLFSILTPCSLPAPGIGVFDAATASTRPSWPLVRDFLTAADPMSISTPAGGGVSPPSSITRGQLWIPLVGSGPAGGLYYGTTFNGTLWWNGETSTFVWVDAPAAGGASACLNSAPLGCLFASTCSLPAGTAQAGRTRRTLPAAFGSSCTLIPDLTVYPR